MSEIKTGDKLPDAEFMVMTADGPAKKSGGEVFSGRKVALFAVPGAFTPTCNNAHLPGFLNNAQELHDKGVEAIVCLAVNDVFTLSAWSEITGAKDKIEMISDWSAEFTKAIGMDVDLGVASLGVRSKRYAMLVDDGTVEKLLVEDAPSSAEASSAEALLRAMEAA